MFPVPKMLSGKNGLAVDLMIVSLASTLPPPYWGARFRWNWPHHLHISTGGSQLLITYSIFTVAFTDSGIDSEPTLAQRRKWRVYLFNHRLKTRSLNSWGFIWIKRQIILAAAGGHLATRRNTSLKTVKLKKDPRKLEAQLKHWWCGELLDKVWLKPTIPLRFIYVSQWISLIFKPVCPGFSDTSKWKLS